MDDFINENLVSLIANIIFALTTSIAFVVVNYIRSLTEDENY
jgi:hypothetical protein